MSILRKIRNRAGLLIGRQKSWEKVEYFEECWKTRIREMARFIAPGESVVDLGCGQMWLRELLRDNEYHPVDYKQRDASVTVANFNSYEYPHLATDVAFVSGALEYIEDYQWFVRQICSHSKRCILSYCTTEIFPDLKMRRLKAWKNHLSQAEVVALFLANGMHMEAASTAVPQNPVFVFSRKDKSEQQDNTVSNVPVSATSEV
ncbi:MAG TPA: hypothetical protein VHD85_12630 [Terracidiphilus sp.]|nr:hypothetical protein [Terracidiphilus sp.]